MLSGVGRSDHLNSLEIPVLAELQVGDHLQDHIALGGMEFTVNKVKNPWYNNNFTLFFEIFQFSFQPFGSLEGRYITLPVFFNYTIN